MIENRQDRRGDTAVVAFCLEHLVEMQVEPPFEIGAPALVEVPGTVIQIAGIVAYLQIAAAIEFLDVVSEAGGIDEHRFVTVEPGPHRFDGNPYEGPARACPIVGENGCVELQAINGIAREVVAVVEEVFEHLLAYQVPGGGADRVVVEKALPDLCLGRLRGAAGERTVRLRLGAAGLAFQCRGGRGTSDEREPALVGIDEVELLVEPVVFIIAVVDQPLAGVDAGTADENLAAVGSTEIC